MSSVCTPVVDEFVVRPIVTGADVLECYRLGGPEFASRLLAYGESALEYYKRCASMQSAAARSASSASSLGSRSSVPITGAGLTGTRLDSIHRVESWRTKGEKGFSKGSGAFGTKSVIADGLCYSKLLNESSLRSTVSKVGEWPTFGSFVRLSSKVFRSMDELEKFRLVKTGEGVFHVAVGGQVGVSFLGAVKGYASRIKAQAGTLASAVQALDKHFDHAFVAGNARIGGDSVVGNRSDGVARSSLGLAGVFGSPGTSLGAVCPVPFGSDAVALFTSLNDVSDIERLFASGFSHLGTERLRVGGIMVTAVFFSAKFLAGSSELRMAMRATLIMHKATAVSLVDVQSFRDLTASDVELLTRL